MKFLKAFVAVLLLIIATLFLIGFFVPEVDGELETRIERPVIQVFAGMMSVQNAPDWVVGLERIERTSGFLAMPGSTFTLYYTGTETEVTYTLEIIEVIPMESVKFKLYNEMLEFEITIRFEADGLATIVRSYVQMKGKDQLSRSFLPLLKSSIMEVGKDNFEAFKQLQEQ